MFHKQSNDANMLDWINIALVWQTTPRQKLGVADTDNAMDLEIINS